MTRSRRIAVVVAATVAGIGVLLGSMRWEIAVERVRGSLEMALARDTGFAVRTIGGVAFTALPWPVLQISGLEVARGETERGSLPLVKARLNVHSWLTGDPRITALSLFEPQLTLTSGATMDETQAVAAILQNHLRRDGRPALSSLRVVSADVRLDGAPWLSRFGLSLTQISSSNLMLSAAGDYRNQRMRLSATIAPASRSTERQLSWELDVGDVNARFAGMLVAPPSLDAEGRISIALGAGALQSRPMSLSREVAGLLDGLSISGQGRVALPQLTLRDAVITRGDLRIEGGIDLSISAARPRFSGTLHADQLQLTPVMRWLETSAGAGGWMATPLKAPWPVALTADARISARRVIAGTAAFEDAAFSLKLSQGRLDASLSEARLRGGLLKGRVTAVETDQTADVRIQAQADQLDVGQALRPFGGNLAGTATGSIQIEGQGRTPRDLIRAMTGRGQLQMRNADLAGFDIEQALRLPDAQAGPLAAGRLRATSVDAPLRIEGGVLHITEGRARAPLWTALFNTSIDLAEGALRGVGRVSPAGAEGRQEPRIIHIDGSPMLPRGRIEERAQFRRS